jgi:phage tail sheath protein FI
MNIATPGVYTQEISKLPPSVAGVATAIPAFIGFTERSNATVDHSNIDPAARYAPEIVRVTSMLEYTNQFGDAYEAAYRVEMSNPGPTIDDISADYRAFLFESIRMYFENGGGPCFIVSIGTYVHVDGDGGIPIAAIDAGKLKDMYDAALMETDRVDEITLLLAPDSLLQKSGEPILSTVGSGPLTWQDADYGVVANSMLTHCNNLKDRFCIFDVLRGYLPPSQPVINGVLVPVQTGFRDIVNASNYGASYYPWLSSANLEPLSYTNIRVEDLGNAPFIVPDVGGTIAAVDGWVAVRNALKAQVELTLGDFPEAVTLSSLWNRYNVLKENYMAQTAAGLQKSTFSSLFSFLAKVAVGFENADQNIGALSNQLVELEADQLLRNEIIKLIDMVNEMHQHAGTEFINTAGTGPYAKFTSPVTLNATNWIVEGAGPAYLTVAAINVGANETSYAPTAVAANVNRLDALLFLETSFEIDLNKLFSSYAFLYSSAEYNYTVAEKALFADHPTYNEIFNFYQTNARIQPSQGAVAGVYAATDRGQGVWKAPANVVINGIIGPVLPLNNSQQDDLNIHADTGKSINAIRTFSGRGSLVWGARTLTGNDNEWRYVPVRRFFIYAEESIKKASEPFVFEPNDGNTWVRVKAMITNFLINQWKAGALLGDSAEQAFFVKVGLNQTMTQQDILEGKMIIEVGLAAVRPAEFIILKFMHQMQE